MSETNSVFWVGDLVRIRSTATAYDGSSLEEELKGDNIYWYITDIDYSLGKAQLGAYRAFGLRYSWSPVISVNVDDIDIIEQTCRHQESDIVIEPAREPTCTEAGCTQKIYCNRCGLVTLQSEVIPPLEHLYEQDSVTGSKICTRCKHEIKAEDRIIDLTGKDILSMIQIIEAILAYNPSISVPPSVQPELPEPQDPIFSSDITFTSEWFTDHDLSYLLYTPSTATTDGTTPLILWLHGSGEVRYQESAFKSRGLPAVLEDWKLQGFNSYILCPVASSDSWTTHKDSVFSLLDHIVTKYNVDTRKICIMGHSLGGIGTEYLAYQKPDYFSCQVIMSGYNSGVDLESLKDLPTRIYAENEYYTPHYNKLKTVFGQDACTVLNCDHGQVPSLALNRETEEGSGISDLIFWILSQVNSKVQQEELVTQPIQLPAVATVTKDHTELRCGPGLDYDLYDTRTNNSRAHAGQQLTIVEIVQDGNYNWGKLDPDTWKKSTTSPSVSSGDRWIALENTTLFSKESFVPPEWVCPLSFVHISSPYGTRSDPFTGELSTHYGIDLAACAGTPIYATRAGTVLGASNRDSSSAGKFVCITHEDGFQSDYFHLDEALVSEHDTVSAGQLIGRCGTTGRSTGPHLHFQIQKNNVRENPENWIKFRNYYKK